LKKLKMGIGEVIKKGVIVSPNLPYIGHNGLNQNKVKFRVFIKG